MNFPLPALKNNKETSLKQKNNQNNLKNKLKDFFTIIPSAYALHIDDSAYNTITINGKTYALLTKQQLQEHSYKTIGIYAENYNCSGLGYWTVKVLTPGVHTQQFNFSGQIAYAYNTVASETCDQGDANTLCVINTIKGVQNNSVLYYHNLTIQNGGALRNQTSTASFNISANNIIIEDGGFIEGNVNINASNLTILSGGLINATGTGYAGATASGGNGNGPGGGEGDGNDGGQGAGYGGQGGNGGDNPNRRGSSYGSITFPLDLGSGGGDGSGADGGSGGGAIFLNITNILNVTGNILAGGSEGIAGLRAGGGGSGGSVYIITNNFYGNGTINASGGSGGDDTSGVTEGGGGGGGGRIAVYYAAKSFTGNILAFGGFSPDAGAGNNGTNFSVSNITVLLTINQTTNVVAGQNLTIYGNLSVSAYNLTNYTFNVYIGDVQYYINDTENVLKNTTTAYPPKTNDTSGGTNTGSFRYNITVPDSFIPGTYTLTVNATLNIISGNASSTFEIPQISDITPPVVNTTLNKSLTSIYQNDIINITANITDETGLSFCQIIINQSGAKEIINISLSGTSDKCSNKFQVIVAAGNVINFTIRVNDTSNNFKTNDTIITVASTGLTAGLKSPANKWYVNSTIVFECNASSTLNIKNITLYHNYTGTWLENISNISSFSTNANAKFIGRNYNSEKTFVWDCQACDVQGVCVFAGINNTLSIDLTNPNITFVNPTESNNAYINKNYTYVNVSVSDNYNNYSAFIDWNKSLVGWWRLEENNGTFFADSSSYGNNGSCSGGTCPNLTTGMRGKAYSFDGVNDYINAGTGASLNITTGDFSLEAWARLDAGLGAWRDIIAKNWVTGNDGWAWVLGKASTDKFKFAWNDVAETVIQGTTVVSLNTWYHVVVTKSGSTITLYVNGTSEATTTVGAIEYTGDGKPVEIGALGTRNIEYWNGLIDEVRIYKRALTSEEINASYNAGSYRLYHNFTNLTDGTYTYKAYATDQAGNYNETEERTLTIDTTLPIINGTLNKSITNIFQNDVINITANITDNVGLSFCQIIINQSGPSALNIINISLSGTTAQCSNKSQVTVTGGNVINFTIRANDTSNNWRTNDTIITVADNILPVVNTTLNKSITSIYQNDIINITANITDETGLSFCQIIINQSGPTALTYINISLSGTSAQCSNKSEVNLAAGNVINYTIRANDTSNNWRTNDTIITVADNTVPVINGTIDNTAPRLGQVINATYNITDETGLSTGNISINISGNPIKNFSFALTGTEAQISQNITINLTAGNVLNITGFAVDTSGNIAQNSTLITVAVTPAGGEQAAPTPSASAAGEPGRSTAARTIIPKEEISNFAVDKNLLKITLKQGEVKQETIDIKNTGNVALDIKIGHDLKNLLVLSEDYFTLKAEESKTIGVNIFASEAQKPGVYTGRLRISSDKKEEVVVVIIEVKEKAALFDVKIEVKEAEVRQDQEIEADIGIFNLGDLKPVDVELYYALRDIDGNDIVFKYETFAVEDEKTVKIRLRIPEDLEPGVYIYYAEARYNSQIASSAGVINVEEREEAIKILASNIKEFITSYLENIIALALMFVLVVLVAYYKYGTEINQRFWQISRYGQRELRTLYVRKERETIPIKKPRLLIEGEKIRVVKEHELAEREEILRKKEKAYAPRKKLFEEFEKEKLLKQIKDWKAKGYDTSLLEAELKARFRPKLGKYELERQKLLAQIKDWKAKGYNTSLLEAELQGKLRKHKLSSEELKMLVRKVREWKSEGYDVVLLEEEIKGMLKEKAQKSVISTPSSKERLLNEK